MGKQADRVDWIADKITNELYGILSLSPRRLIKHYFTCRLSPMKCVKSRKCQSVKELEVVVTLSNAQGSKSQQE